MCSSARSFRILQPDTVQSHRIKGQSTAWQSRADSQDAHSPRWRCTVRGPGRTVSGEQGQGMYSGCGPKASVRPANTGRKAGPSLASVRLPACTGPPCGRCCAPHPRAACSVHRVCAAFSRPGHPDGAALLHVMGYAGSCTPHARHHARKTFWHVAYPCGPGLVTRRKGFRRRTAATGRAPRSSQTSCH